MTDRRVDPPDGFDEFASAQARQLLRIAFLMCGDWHQAEDLVQATLAKVYAGNGTLPAKPGPSGIATPVVTRAAPPGSFAQWNAIADSPAWH